MFPSDLVELAADVIARCRKAGLSVGTAESCTGGMIGACLTEVAGSSDVFDRGFITYSNAAKAALLGVPEALLADHGAVSEPVARAMAVGAVTRGGVDLAVAVTGIAGPGGGRPGKPVGLVHIAAARRRPGRAPDVVHEMHNFAGTRTDVRLLTVRAALILLSRLP